MKKFKELRESINQISDTSVLDTNIINNLTKFAQQISMSFQPDIRVVIDKIENELNKFALTLGDVDLDTPFEREGTDDYIVFFNYNKEPVKNMFLTLSWERVQGQQFQYTNDGSKLTHNVHLIVNLTSPEDMEDMLNDEDDTEMMFIHMEEEADSLDEARSRHEIDWDKSKSKILSLSPEQEKKKEKYVKGMKKNFKDFKAQYGDKAKEVIYATAHKMALKDSMNEEKSDTFRVYKFHKGNEYRYLDGMYDKKRSESEHDFKKRIAMKSRHDPKDLSIELHEGTWAFPKSNKDLHDLHKVLRSPIHIKDAHQKMAGKLGDDELYDHLDELKADYENGGRDKSLTDVRWAIAHFMNSKGLPVPKHLQESINESKDAIDTITLNVPAFIRCLEHAKEDIKEDAELHEFTEHLLDMSKKKDVLETDDYEKAVEMCKSEEKEEMK